MSRTRTAATLAAVLTAAAHTAANLPQGAQGPDSPWFSAWITSPCRSRPGSSLQVTMASWVHAQARQAARERDPQSARQVLGRDRDRTHHRRRRPRCADSGVPCAPRRGDGRGVRVAFAPELNRVLWRSTQSEEPAAAATGCLSFPLGDPLRYVFSAGGRSRQLTGRSTSGIPTGRGAHRRVDRRRRVRGRTRAARGTGCDNHRAGRERAGAGAWGGRQVPSR